MKRASIYKLLICMFTGLFVFSGLGVYATPQIGSVQVGPQADGGTVIPTSQLLRPAGTSVEFHGRPTDVVLSPNGKLLYTVYERGLLSIRVGDWKIIHDSPFPEANGSIHGLAITKDGSRIYAGTSRNSLWEISASGDGSFKWERKIQIPGPKKNPESPACICGIALSSDETKAYICLSRNDSLGIVDLKSGKLVEQIEVGVAPFDVVVSSDGTEAYVSNWGGRHPEKGERAAGSSGSEALMDERSIGSSGSVSIVDLNNRREIAEVETGLHPSDIVLAADGSRLYVANSNSDTVSVIDTNKRKVAKTILVRPSAVLPFGSSPNALALSRDGSTLYAANAGNNAVAVVNLKSALGSRYSIKGFIPTAWYPGALASDGRALYIANVKGLGSRYKTADAKGWDSYGYLGTISKVSIPTTRQLAKYTSQVRQDARIPQMLLAKEKASTGIKPTPVPQRTGEPSVFDHVVYIIKENKTYDQMFGDLPRGNNDPNLCIFGRDVTPNHHSLAEQFVQLDNYYCNGVLSADGHHWATEGNVTDYLEKAFGGFPRSYGWDSDPLTLSSSGFIWDNVLAHGLSFRNYGEYGDADTTPDGTWKEIYEDYVNKTGKFKYNQYIFIENLKRYSCIEYPGWAMKIPDVARADIFLKEFRECEKTGDWPSLTTIYLPNDHTSGGVAGSPTPRAQVADNDLALGRIVEAITKSRFWEETCIFVEEDDPQSGFDHVDGHRSICLVISPYTKRGALISNFYNQTSVLHTMEQILGIPPMNQMDAMSPLMTDCFSQTPDMTSYTCLPNRIPLDEISERAAYDYTGRTELEEKKYVDSFRIPDRIDDNQVNRILWLMTKGPNDPYPAEYAGAHGRGLKALNLQIVNAEDDD
ncbi:MAG TPA: alkaline phosphatase family protein [Armatimonadota bacterium]